MPDGLRLARKLSNRHLGAGHHHVQRRKLLLRVKTIIATWSICVAASAVVSLPAGAAQKIHISAASCANEATVRVMSGDGARFEQHVILPADVEVPAGRGEIVTERCWAPAFVVAEAQTTALQITLWPRSEIAGTFVRPKGAPDVTALKVHVSSPPHAALTIDSGASDCTVRGNRFACAVPAGELDLRFQADGFAPVWLWNRTLVAGKTADAGSITLTPGGSVSGWVTLDGRQPANAHVDLVPDSLAPDHAAARRTVATNARGFFQFSGVGSGIYRLIANAEKRSAATANRVEIRAAESLTLEEPLIIEPLARFDVMITPPVPSQGRWQVSLERAVAGTTYTKVIAAAPAQENGAWMWDELERGTYFLTVADAGGTSFYDGAISIEAGMPPMQIVIDAVAVEGTVTAGKEPLEALLRFSLLAPGARHASLKSDAEGRFHGLLPAAGRYDITVRRAGTDADLQRPDVAIHKRSDGAALRLDLEFPAGRFRAIVMDRRRKPLRSRFSLLRRDGMAVLASGVASIDGRIDVAGLDTGPALLHIEGAPNEVVLPVTISDGDAPELEVTVPDKRTARGVVRDARGLPVAGAQVLWSTLLGSVQRVVAGPDGSFELWIPEGAGAIDLAALHPAYPITFFTLPIPEEGRSLDVALAPAGGTLLVGLERGLPSIRCRGAAFPVATFLLPGDDGGAPRNLSENGIVLNLAPGQYQICGDGNDCEAATVLPGSSGKVRL